MLLINDVNITPNPVGTNEKLLVSVTIITWDYLLANYTWDSLKNSGKTWDDLKGEKK